MVDLRDQLSTWRIRSPAVRDLGKRIQQIAIEVGEIYSNHVNISNECDFSHLEGRSVLNLAKEARAVQRDSENARGETGFDETARLQFMDMASSNAEYLEWAGDPLGYFGVVSEGKVPRAQVNHLLDSMYLPRINPKHPPSYIGVGLGKVPANRGMVHRAVLAKYHKYPEGAIEKRRELLKPYDWGDSTSGEANEHIMFFEMQRLRGAVLDCLHSYGIINSEDVSEMHRMADEAEAIELKLMQHRLAGEWQDLTKSPLPELRRGLMLGSGRRKPVRFLMDWSDDIFSTADLLDRTIEMRDTLLQATQHRVTGAYKFARGEAILPGVHEVTHTTNFTFSEGMPRGLSNDGRELSWSNFALIEGVTSWAEANLALPWLERNYRAYGMTKTDVELARLGIPDRERAFRARLCHAINAMSSGNTEGETYTDTKNPVHRVSENFPTEKMADLLFFASYDIGAPMVTDLTDRIRSMERLRLRSKEAGDAYFNQYFPQIILGTQMGGWSPVQLPEWMFRHFLPKLHHITKDRPVGEQVVVPAAYQAAPSSAAE